MRGIRKSELHRMYSHGTCGKYTNASLTQSADGYTLEESDLYECGGDIPMDSRISYPAKIDMEARQIEEKATASTQRLQAQKDSNTNRIFLCEQCRMVTR